MRKGILSLSKAGKKKTQNMEMTDQQLDNQPLAPEQETPCPEEKLFVQTIQVPKPGTVHRKKSRKQGTKKTPFSGQQAGQ